MLMIYNSYAVWVFVTNNKLVTQNRVTEKWRRVSEECGKDIQFKLNQILTSTAMRHG